MDLPSFSIITVTYNAAKVLEKTILSVINQTYCDIELIIIDGDSKDETVNIIRQYESNISYWISEPDQGIYDAMNKGLLAATGDYVWFLNAGDELQNHMIVWEVAKIAFQKRLPDILYGETDLIDFEGKILGKRRLKAPQKLDRKSFKMGMLVCHQAFIVKRSIAPEYNLQYRFSADFEWCIRCMKKTKKITHTQMRLVYYLYEGLTTANRKKSLKERYAIMCKYYGTFVTSTLHIWFAIRFYWAKFTKQTI